MRRRILGTSAIWAAMVVALALVMVMGSGTAHAAIFNPSGTLCLNDQATLPTSVAYAPCDGSHAPGASDAIAARFGIGLGANNIPEAGGGDDTPDSNFGGVISFTPPEWVVAAGADIPDGTLVAKLYSMATLGLLGNHCSLGIQVSFDLVDGSTNPADTIPVKPPGAKDRLEPLAKDDNGNGVFDGAEWWPAYLNDLFEDEIAAGVPDPLPNIRARLFGINNTAVAETTIVLNFLIFEPGTELSEHFNVDSRLGYPSVTVLQDPTAPASGSDPINDFCSPLLSVTNTVGITKDNPNSPAMEGGNPYRTNPCVDGGFNFVTFSASLPDADNDGIENPLDPCPFDPDPTWNPRSGTPGPIPGDSDGDGLPDSCDPYPNVKSDVIGSILDEDRDGWMNRSDNCPLVANPDNNDEDGDGIGDACDPDIDRTAECEAKGERQVGTKDGCIKSKCFVTEIDIGAGGTPAVDPLSLAPCDVDAPDYTGTIPSPSPCPGPADGDGGGDGGAQNNPPTCENAEVNTFEGISASFELDCSDQDGDDLTCSIDTQPANGTATVASDCSATYSPDAGFSGSDPFTYKANDGTDDSDAATVSVDVTPLEVGLNFNPTETTVPPGGSTELQAICAEQVNSLQAVSGEDITFKIDSQPGSDADLDGESEVTKTSDAEGVAKATLNVGSTVGEIVVSAEGCGQTETRTVTVTGEVLGETAGPSDAAGGAATGVGSLAPVASSIPIWAAIASSLGGAGLLGALGAFLARIVRRRR